MVTTEQLVSRIRAGEDTEKNMALLYDQVKNFIRSIAWQYRETRGVRGSAAGGLSCFISSY